MNNQIQLFDEIDAATPSLPNVGWLQVRQKAGDRARRKGNDAPSLTTSGPIAVRITRWIE
jgi:hypothetical protein